jgi:hypothetical protein
MNCELMLTYDASAYMFNVYKNQLSWQTGSRNLETTFQELTTRMSASNEGNNYTPAPPEGGILLFFLCPSFCPSKIFFIAFFSATIDDRKSCFH